MSVAPLQRAGAALIASAALHAAVLAVAPALFAAPAVPAAAPHQAPLEVRLLAELPANANAKPKTPRAGSELAAGPRLGAVEGPKYFRASELDSKPFPLAAVEPVPPPGEGNRYGKVIARVLISESGRADAVRIESSGPAKGFDEAVKKAFGSARYQPGTKNGINVKSQMLIEVTFHGGEESRPRSPRPR
jgi:TonB family protein